MPEGGEEVVMSPSKRTSPKREEKKEEVVLRSRTLESDHGQDKRRHPRWLVELPLDYSRKGEKADWGGMVKNVSEGGILVYLPEKVDVGEKLKVEIYFAKGLRLNTVQGVAKIVWADLAGKETWKEHSYGLEFHSMPKAMIQKLRELLKEVKETHPS